MVIEIMGKCECLLREYSRTLWKQVGNRFFPACIIYPEHIKIIENGNFWKSYAN